MFVFFKLFLVLSFKSLISRGVMGKEVISRLSFCLESFQMKANGEHKFLLFFSSVNYRRIYSIHLKNSCFAEDVLFYLRNEVMAFPKIEMD